MINIIYGKRKKRYIEPDKTKLPSMCTLQVHEAKTKDPGHVYQYVQTRHARSGFSCGV